MRRWVLAAALISAITAVSAVAAVSAVSASSHGRSRRSPHVEVTVLARVESVPVRIRHANGREFEELDVSIVSARPAGPGPAIATSASVHVVHDLTCGGSWLDSRPGDQVEIRGEYVHPGRGADLIHFTHAASGQCGSSSHADGYLRPARQEVARSETGGEDLFVSVVRPVVSRRCLCHEKGGRMYGRLPFDDPSVLSAHAAGVRRRLKGDDLAAFEKWMATLPSAAPAPGS